jgi:hypothetical protein
MKLNRLMMVPALGLFTVMLGACGPLSTSGDEQKLGNVQYTVRAMYEGHERTMSITPDGQIRIVEELHDNGRQIEDKITPNERADLIAAFKGWSTLKGNYFVDVSPQIVIGYEGHNVTTSNVDSVPEPFKQAKTVLDRIAISRSKAADAQAATATAPSSQPATMPGN